MAKELRVLYMPIKKIYFDQIKAGTKKEEYRTYGEYWRARLHKKEYDVILFQVGYRADAERLCVKFLGCEKKRDIYVVKLGAILPYNS
jgi:hypothetical protein